MPPDAISFPRRWGAKLEERNLIKYTSLAIILSSRVIRVYVPFGAHRMMRSELFAQVQEETLASLARASYSVVIR